MQKMQNKAVNYFDFYFSSRRPYLSLIESALLISESKYNERVIYYSFAVLRINNEPCDSSNFIFIRPINRLV